MTGVSIDTVDDELSVRNDEAGTAPGDRRFRPDVEGLRAVAMCWWCSTTPDFRR